MRARASSGFTFVELMCASAVFLFGLIGLLSLDGAAAAEAARASHQARARLIANNVLSLGQALPLATINAWAAAPVTTLYDAMGNPSTGVTGFFTATTTTLTNSTGGRDVRVTLVWQEPQDPSSRTLQMQRTIPIP